MVDGMNAYTRERNALFLRPDGSVFRRIITETVRVSPSGEHVIEAQPWQGVEPSDRLLSWDSAATIRREA
jgi:hypothetical protein